MCRAIISRGKPKACHACCQEGMEATFQSPRRGIAQSRFPLESVEFSIDREIALRETVALFCFSVERTSDSSRAGRTEQLNAKIEQSLDELGAALQSGESRQLVAFLECLSRFHRYSFGNVMLIATARPQATRVAGFQTWKKLGRFVRKGEKGIAILAPIVRKLKIESEDELGESKGQTVRKAVGYKSVHVFDVAQTEGKPLPEFARVAGDPGEYIDRIRQQIKEAGIELTIDDIASGADGVSRGGSIVIRPGLSAAEEFSILVHEYGHEILHRSARRTETTKQIRETEAEAVAFTVCRAIGLETGSASSDYIQLYNGSRDTLQESLHHIRDCASRILDGLIDHGPKDDSSSRIEFTHTHDA